MFLPQHIFQIGSETVGTSITLQVFQEREFFSNSDIKEGF